MEILDRADLTEEVNELLNELEVTKEEVPEQIESCTRDLDKARDEGAGRSELQLLEYRLEDLQRVTELMEKLAALEKVQDNANPQPAPDATNEELQNLKRELNRLLGVEQLEDVQSYEDLNTIIRRESRRKLRFENRGASEVVAEIDLTLQNLFRVQNLSKDIIKLTRGREDGFNEQDGFSGEEASDSTIDVPEEDFESRGHEGAGSVWAGRVGGAQVAPCEFKEELPVQDAPLPVQPGTPAYQFTHRSQTEKLHQFFQAMFEAYRVEAPSSFERHLGMLDYYTRNEIKKPSGAPSLMSFEEAQQHVAKLKQLCEDMQFTATGVFQALDQLEELFSEPHNGTLSPGAVKKTPGLIEQLRTRLCPLDALFLRYRLRENSVASKVMSNKKVILTVGPTRAGKSTTIFWLAGSRMRLYDIDGAIHIAPEAIHNSDLRNISSSPFLRSETRGLIAVRVHCPEYSNGPSVEYVLADSPGFGDTDGAEYEIAAGVSVLNGVATSESVRLLVIIPFGDGDLKTISAIARSLSLMLNDLEKQLPAVTYAFTRTGGMHFPRREIPTLLKRAREDLDAAHQQDEALKIVLDDILIKMKDYLYCLDPLHDMPQALTNTLVSTTPIMDPQDAFVQFRSNHSTQVLKQQLSLDLHLIRIAAERSSAPFILFKLGILQDINKYLNDPLISDCIRDSVLLVKKAMAANESEFLRCLSAVELHESDTIDSYVDSMRTAFEKLISLGGVEESISTQTLATVSKAYEEATSRMAGRLEDLLTSSSAASQDGKPLGTVSIASAAGGEESKGCEKEGNPTEEHGEGSSVHGSVHGSFMGSCSVPGSLSQESESWLSFSRQQYWDIRELLKKLRVLKEEVAETEVIREHLRKHGIPSPRFDSLSKQLIQRYEAVLNEARTSMRLCNLKRVLRFTDELDSMQCCDVVLGNYDMHSHYEALKEEIQATFHGRGGGIAELLSQDDEAITEAVLRSEVVPALEMLQEVLVRGASVEGLEAERAKELSKSVLDTAVKWQTARYEDLIELADQYRFAELYSALPRVRVLPKVSFVAEKTRELKTRFLERLGDMIRSLVASADSTVMAIHRGDQVDADKLPSILNSLRDVEQLGQVYPRLRLDGFSTVIGTVQNDVQSLWTQLQSKRITIYSDAQLPDIHDLYVRLSLFAKCSAMDSELEQTCREALAVIDSSLIRCFDEALTIFSKDVLPVDQATAGMIFVCSANGIGSRAAQERRETVESEMLSAGTRYMETLKAALDDGFAKLRVEPTGMMQEVIMPGEELGDYSTTVQAVAQKLRALQQFSSAQAAAVDAQSFAAKYRLKDGHNAFQILVHLPREISSTYAELKIPELAGDFQALIHTATINGDIVSLQTIQKLLRHLRSLDIFQTGSSSTFAEAFSAAATATRDFAQNTSDTMQSYAISGQYIALADIIRETEGTEGFTRQMDRAKSQVRAGLQQDVRDLITLTYQSERLDSTMICGLQEKFQQFTRAYTELPPDWTTYLTGELPSVCQGIFEHLVANGYNVISSAIDTHDYKGVNDGLVSLRSLKPALELLPKPLQQAAYRVPSEVRASSVFEGSSSQVFGEQGE